MRSVFLPQRTGAHWWAIAIIASVLALSSLLMMSGRLTLPSKPYLGAAVIALTIGLWSTTRIPEVVTALIFFLLCMVLWIAPSNIVFSGFGSPALWLALGGILISLATDKTGLGRNLARGLLCRTGNRYGAVLFGVVVLGTVLVPLLPSGTGRVVLLAPILISVATEMGFEPGSDGFNGLVLTGLTATAVPGISLIGSHLSNIIMAGAAENIHGIKLTYGYFALLNAPTIGVMSALLIFIAGLTTFKAQSSQSSQPDQPLSLEPRQRVLLIIIFGVSALCMLDSLHGISPAWIVLGGGILCLLPRIGVIDTAEIKGVNLGILIYFAAVIGLGAVATHTGLAAEIGNFIAANMDVRSAPGWAQYASLLSIGSLVTITSGDLASPAIMTSLAQQLATATGWSISSVLLVQVPSWALVAIPYQSSLLLIAFGLVGVSVRTAMRFIMIYFGLSLIVLAPLHYLWVHFLGAFP